MNWFITVKLLFTAIYERKLISGGFSIPRQKKLIGSFAEFLQYRVFLDAFHILVQMRCVPRNLLVTVEPQTSPCFIDHDHRIIPVQ